MKLLTLKKKTRRALLALLLIATTTGVKAQQFAVKTNLLGDATASINLGAEMAIAPRWTLELEGQLNAWKITDTKRWKHWGLMPEARYWFCDRFAGHFLGAHILGGQLNMGGFNGRISWAGHDLTKLANQRIQGWFVGAGIAYGYDFILTRHLNLELELGVGYVYLNYDTFRCAGCGRRLETDKDFHYVGPTKAAVNLVYTF